MTTFGILSVCTYYTYVLCTHVSVNIATQTHSSLWVSSPVCVDEAGMSIGGPGPAQVRQSQRGANQHCNTASPDGVAQVDLGDGS